MESAQYGVVETVNMHYPTNRGWSNVVERKRCSIPVPGTDVQVDGLVA